MGDAEDEQRIAAASKRRVPIWMMVLLGVAVLGILAGLLMTFTAELAAPSLL